MESTGSVDVRDSEWPPYALSMQRMDARGWPLNIAAGIVIIGSATVVAVDLHRAWSWPLFAWGAAWGPVASVWAYFSTKLFGRRLMMRAPVAEREAVAARGRALWPRYRATYAGLVLLGVGVGIFSAGMHNAAVDVGLIAVWVLFGLLPPLITFPVLMRRFPNRPGGDDANA